jgi:hypothetical protein
MIKQLIRVLIQIMNVALNARYFWDIRCSIPSKGMSKETFLIGRWNDPVLYRVAKGYLENVAKVNTASA